MNGHENCKIVVFTNKAYNAIINETFRKDPVETGGILMGHVLSNGCWIVMEVIPPGLKAIHQRAYFEYDTEFVNYMAKSVSKQYKMELDVLGLWHRHPGSMDVFSGTDDGTNATFANLSDYGAISGLVNVDPKFRFTLRHVNYPLDYQIVDVEVGDDLIPPQYFELKYSFGDNLSPTAPIANESTAKTQVVEPERQGDESSNGNNDSNDATQTLPQNHENKSVSSHNKKPFIDRIKKLLYVLIPLLCLIIGFALGSSNGKEKKQALSENEQLKKELSELNEEKEKLKFQINTLTSTNEQLNQTLATFYQICGSNEPVQDSTNKKMPKKIK